MDFLSIKNVDDVAKFLQISKSELIFLSTDFRPQNKYYEFKINKKSGGLRQIYAPTKRLNRVQKKISQALTLHYRINSCAHGFLPNRSILSNASQHVGKKTIINLDIQDFFPDINFGRVRGLFLSFPFHFSNEVATVLANICCYKNYLPQGSPSSPIISNFICSSLDKDLMRFAKENRCLYSRYADDITFSTNQTKIPGGIGTIENCILKLSSYLENILHKNGFRINYKKVRYAFSQNRREVTGLIVNEKINVKRKYIKNIRAIINAWEKYGITKAAAVHQNKQIKHSVLTPKLFEKRVIGQVSFIGMVRGKDDDIYKKLYQRIKKISPLARLSIIQNQISSYKGAVILTEGKTDWKHMTAALSKLKELGEFNDLKVTFSKNDENITMGSADLLSACSILPKTNVQDKIVICIFDRDEGVDIEKVTSFQNQYKHWGNNIYSMVLPVPPHRRKDICIEHYYTDDEIITPDNKNRRLYLSTEFKEDGLHLNGTCAYQWPKKLKKLYKDPKIIDSSVIDADGNSIALSKNAFAENILNGKTGFNNFGLDSFRLLFQSISNIVLKRNI